MNTELIRTAVRSYVICYRCHIPLYFESLYNHYSDVKTPDDAMRLCGYEECVDFLGEPAVICSHCKAKRDNSNIGDLENCVLFRGIIKCFIENCDEAFTIDLCGASLSQSIIHKSTEMAAQAGWTARKINGTHTAYCPTHSKNK